MRPTTKPCSARQHHRLPKDGIDRHVRLGEPSINPENRGTKGAWWYRLTVAPASRRRSDCGCGSRRRTVATPTRWAAFSTNCSPPGRPGRRVLRRLGTPQLPGDELEVAMRGVCRDDLEQAVLPVRRAALAGRRPGQPARPAGDPAQSQLAPRRLPTSFPCRMPGSIPGSPLGTWPSTPSCSLTSTLLTRYQLLLMCREWYMHPNGALPAYEWNFGDTTRRCTRGRRCGSSRSTARTTTRSWPRSSRNCS